MTTPPTPTDAMVEAHTAWLCEYMINDTPHYWGFVDGLADWITDHDAALQFARRQDAQNYIDDIGWTEAVAIEHMWLGPRTAALQHQEPGGKIVRHNRRKTEYVEIGRGYVQAEKPIGDLTEIVIYRGIEDGKYWVRPTGEFDDPLRFEVLEVATPPAPSALDRAVETNITDVVRQAMEDAWSDICSDTGNHPLDIEHSARKHLTFTPLHWARQTGDLVASRLAEPIAALNDVAEDVCGALCPSQWKTADGPPPHHAKCIAVRAALSAIRGNGGGT